MNDAVNTRPVTERLHFWFEAVTMSKDRNPSTLESSTWLYQVGEGESTPVALIAGRNDYEACARARLICAALNQAAIAAELVQERIK